MGEGTEIQPKAQNTTTHSHLLALISTGETWSKDVPEMKGK